MRAVNKNNEKRTNYSVEFVRSSGLPLTEVARVFVLHFSFPPTFARPHHRHTVGRQSIKHSLQKHTTVTKMTSAQLIVVTITNCTLTRVAGMMWELPSCTPVSARPEWQKVSGAFCTPPSTIPQTLRFPVQSLECLTEVSRTTVGLYTSVDWHHVTTQPGVYTCSYRHRQSVSSFN